MLGAGGAEFLHNNCCSLNLGLGVLCYISACGAHALSMRLAASVSPGVVSERCATSWNLLSAHLFRILIVRSEPVSDRINLSCADVKQEGIIVTHLRKTI